MRAALRPLSDRRQRGINPGCARGTERGGSMIWLIVLISINGGPQQVVDKILYEDMQSCKAEKAARDSRMIHFVGASGFSMERKVICSVEPAAPVG
jgi:hypothetical protein